MKEILLSWLGGAGITVAIYVVFRVVIWIVRHTQTQADDKIIDNYVSKAVDFALSVIPKNSQVNWVKFTANALGEFSKAYTKEQGDVPNTSTMEKAKSLITEIADSVEFKELKTAIAEIKGNQEIK